MLHYLFITKDTINESVTYFIS